MAADPGLSPEQREALQWLGEREPEAREQIAEGLAVVAEQPEVGEAVEEVSASTLIEKLGLTRRQAIAVMSLVIGGMALPTAVMKVAADASTSDSDGDVGQSGDRVDVFADGVDANSVTTDKTDTSGGYTWQDVSGSRSFDSWESAPSDRDIWVSVNAQATSDSTEISIIPNVNTSQSQNRLGRHRDTVDTGGRLDLFFKVPAGQDYKIESFGDTGSYSKEEWMELR